MMPRLMSRAIKGHLDYGIQLRRSILGTQLRLRSELLLSLAYWTNIAPNPMASTLCTKISCFKAGSKFSVHN